MKEGARHESPRLSSCIRLRVLQMHPPILGVFRRHRGHLKNGYGLQPSRPQVPGVIIICCRPAICSCNCCTATACIWLWQNNMAATASWLSGARSRKSPSACWRRSATFCCPKLTSTSKPQCAATSASIVQKKSGCRWAQVQAADRARLIHNESGSLPFA